VKTYLDCYPCFLRQALEGARIGKADEQQQRLVLNRALETLRRIEPWRTPPEIADRIHWIVRRTVGNSDPYRAAKETSTGHALALYPRLKTLVAEASDPLDVAVRLSIAGNIIDLGPNLKYDLWETVERTLIQPFAVDDRPAFRDALDKAERVLYLADNAGETVFDRVLIETLHAPVSYAVKGGPILNDATLEDALAAGVGSAAKIISTGSDAPGTILRSCSQEFRQLYEEADLVIAKGQANYETLSADGARTFFLLQAKCSILARDAGVPVGSIVLKQGQGRA
jgi:damage-control phosphatase, subfamily I